MELSSPDFSDGEVLDPRFTCDGDDISPGLRWTDIPEGTAELALVCEDPDAPRGTFVHWLVWGISPSEAEVAGGAVPGTTQGTNGFGTVGYRGPCPPPGHGTHHYRFTLFALSEPLSLGERSTIDHLQNAIGGRALGEATITATYSR